MKSSEQLELEAEEIRGGIDETLGELRSRVTPGQVVDQLVEYSRGTNGGLMVRNLRRQIVNNPLPLVLIGTGLAWIMATDATRRSRQDVDIPDGDGESRTLGAARSAATSTKRAARDARNAISDAAEAAEESMRGASESVRDAASRYADAASSALEETKDAAARSADAVRSGMDQLREGAMAGYRRARRATRRTANAIGDSSSAMARTLQDRGGDLVDFCREQPLVLGGIGLAVGAALGAMLPASEVEDELVGEASDDLKERTRHVAAKARESVKATYDEAMRAVPSGQHDNETCASPEERPEPQARS